MTHIPPRVRRVQHLVSLLLWLAACSSDSNSGDASNSQGQAGAAGDKGAVSEAGKTAAAAGTAGSAGSSGAAATPAAPPEITPWGFDLEGIDESIRPGASFNRYANGKWLDANVIPDDRVSWGPFDKLALEANLQVQGLVALPPEAVEVGSDARKVREYYAAFLDTQKIEDAGLAPLQAGLAEIAAAASYDELAKLMGRADLGLPSPIGIYVDVDSKDPERYVVGVQQSGLSLPDRDYYLEADATYVELRTAYEAHIARIFKLIGVAEADSSVNAKSVVDLETQLAMRHWPIEMRRDRDATYNARTRAELIDEAKGFPWQVTLSAAGIGEQDTFIVAELSAVVDLASFFSSVPVDTWIKYLTYNYVVGHANFLPKAIDDENFAFYGKTLNGQPVSRARELRAASAVNAALGEAVGKLYVAEHFPEANKQAMKGLVENLRQTFSQRIKDLSWMSDSTKAAAQKKLDTFNPKIGYPDKWKDYSTLDVLAGDAFGNAVRSAVWHWQDDISHLGKPTDRSEWFTTPQTVNAYYNPTFNEILFPAAILQPPFFDPNADPAVNYGSIGAVIGHEMGHGFDDQGAKSDERGVLRTWWQPEDEAKFTTLVDKLIAQYNTYEVLPGLFVNGALTVGENIGDLGGLTVAYYAYKTSLQGTTAPVLDGLTGDQRFFLGWAQVWRELDRDESLRNQVMSDPHSPSNLRIDGVVRNIDAFYDAYAVTPEDALYLAPEDRVHIW